jgi:hypothetical protein
MGIPKGKPTSLMQPQPLSEVHPFVPTLHKWRHGIKVDCRPVLGCCGGGSSPWSSPNGIHPRGHCPFQGQHCIPSQSGLMQSDAVGGHQAAVPEKPQDLASCGCTPSWLARAYHLRLVVPCVPRCQWDCDGRANKHQQHHPSQCPLDPHQRNWQGAPWLLHYMRDTCRSSYSLFKIGHQQWILAPHCPRSRQLQLLGLYNILDRYSRYLRTSTYVQKIVPS